MSIHTLAQCIGNHQHMPSPGPGSTGGKKGTENGVKRKKKSAGEARRAVDWREGKGGRFGR